MAEARVSQDFAEMFAAGCRELQAGSLRSPDEIDQRLR
jgi:hypothetical protein